MKAQLMTIQDNGEAESEEERDALTRCLALIDAESKASKAVRDAQAALDQRVLSRYASLTETEIKTLVVEDKWFTSIWTAVEGEVQRMTQQLAGRVKELEERYAQPLPVLEREVEVFSERVEDHLRKMGGGVGMKAVAASQMSNLTADESAAIPSRCKQTVTEIPEDWKTARIDVHASITTGSRNTQDKEDAGEYPFFVRSQEVERINSFSYDGEAVLTAGDGVGTGKVFHYIVGRFDVHQRVYRISDFSDELIGRFFLLPV